MLSRPTVRWDLGLRHALLPEWRQLFSRRYLREDLVAGLSVACVALPLSLAIALASGAPPAAGVITSIVAGLVCALFGGTRLAVTGPAAAMAVLLGSLAEAHGARALLLVGLGCGALQLATGVLGLGRLARFVPVPVVAGFMAGMGALLFVGQLPRALGVSATPGAHALDVLRGIPAYVAHANGFAVVLSVGAALLCLLLPLRWPRAPAALIAVIAATLATALLRLDVPRLGALPTTLPAPSLPGIPAGAPGALATATFMVYALASLETLLSSSAVDKLAGHGRHDPDQEMIGQGLGNLAAALFGGMPATGVIFRSALNVQAGAKTRRASAIHSLALLAFIAAFAPWIARIPIAALSGVLLSVALRLLRPRDIATLYRTSHSEAAVFLVTFVVIVVGDLFLGVQVGLGAALVVAVLRLGQMQAELHAQERADHARVTVHGPATFLSSSRIERLRRAIDTLPPGRPVVIELYELAGLDVSGAEMLVDLVAHVTSRGSPVVLVGLAERYAAALHAADADDVLRGRVAASEVDVLRLLNPGDPARPIERLRAGVLRFQREAGQRQRGVFAQLAAGQSPHTLFVSCVDSRVVPTLLTSTDPGELLQVRNVGNMVPPAGLGEAPAEGAAVEFAIAALGVREIVVCGHSGCGAMKAVLAGGGGGGQMPALAQWLAQCDELRHKLPAGADAADASKANVVQQLENLRSYPLVRSKLASGELQLHGWYYDIGAGNLWEWDEGARAFVPLHAPGDLASPGAGPRKPSLPPVASAEPEPAG